VKNLISYRTMHRMGRIAPVALAAATTANAVMVIVGACAGSQVPADSPLRDSGTGEEDT
jgi:hypothetical protein